MAWLLIFAAATVAVVAVVVLAWFQIDKRLSGHASDQSVDELATRLASAESEMTQLRDRVEDLETIATAGQMSERSSSG